MGSARGDGAGRRRSLVLSLSGAAIALIGLAVGVGGLWLIALDGSCYYALASLGLVVTGASLMARRAAALPIYALVVVGTTIWAVAEVRLDWWQLVPRGGVVWLIGLYLLMPWTARGLTRNVPGPAPAGWRRDRLILAASLLLATVVGGIALSGQRHDQPGTLPDAKFAAAPPVGVADANWPSYGRTNFGQRYSPLTQITPNNVSGLQVAWQYHTGDMRRPSDPVETTDELTPIKIDDTIYICTPHDWAIALDAETGRQKWKYDPGLDEKTNLQHLTCRGVSFHDQASRGLPASDEECSRRVFLPTADARLIALDARSGQPCPHFGSAGQVDLWAGMPAARSGMYYSTSPPVVTRDLVIVAGEVTDNYSMHEPSGVIRAYDVDTGKLVWNWDAGNPGETAPLPPGRSYTENSPNSWSVSSADEDLGLLYVPMGNQTPDEWGVGRSQNAERFASSITALDLATGSVRWVFQTVHHDLWDMDVPSQPSLLDLDTPTGRVPALVQSTKRGDVYVLDRRDGRPIIPVEERPVPGGAVAPDRAAPTQPFSALSLMPAEPLRERDMWGVTLFDQLACRIQYRRRRYDGMFTPPSLQGSISYPGNFGVVNWGGIAVDPVRQVAFANPDYLAFVTKLIPHERREKAGPPQPAEAADAADGADSRGLDPMIGTPYAVKLGPFLSPLGLPCQAPPWGSVAGIDLRAGKVVYTHPNGTVRDQTPIPLPFRLGVPSLGGPIVTAGGVAFLTSTLDRFIRAYDLTTGRQLWEDRLPAGGQATPMTYQSPSGRQMVVAVAGGHGSLRTKPGDSIIAYALPRP